MKKPNPHVDEIREIDDVFTANVMLKDGWILLEIIQARDEPLYILGKRRFPKGATGTAVQVEPPLLADEPKALPRPD